MAAQPPEDNLFFVSFPYAKDRRSSSAPVFRIFFRFLLGQYCTNRQESLAKKIRQNPQTHLRGVAQGFTNAFLAEKIRQNPQAHLRGVAL